MQKLFSFTLTCNASGDSVEDAFEKILDQFRIDPASLIGSDVQYSEVDDLEELDDPESLMITQETAIA